MLHTVQSYAYCIETDSSFWNEPSSSVLSAMIVVETLTNMGMVTQLAAFLLTDDQHFREKVRSVAIRSSFGLIQFNCNCKGPSV